MQQTIRPRRDSWPHNLERREALYLLLRRHGGSAPLSGADRDRGVVSAEPLPPHADYRDMGTGECDGIISEDMRGTGLSTLPRALILRRFSRSDSAIVDPATMRIFTSTSPISPGYSEKSWLHEGGPLTETPPTSPEMESFRLPPRSVDRHDGFQRLNSCDSEMVETATTRPLLSLTIDTASTTLRSHDAGLTLTVGTPETVYCKGFDSPSRPLTPMRRHIPKGNFSSLFGSAAQPALPDGWRRVEHCQGSTYFVNDDLRIATPSRMDDPILRKELDPHLASLLSKFPDGSVPEGHEAVLCLDADTRNCEYYMCDHEEMIVYWLDDVTAEGSEYLSIPETVSDRHLGTFLKAFYFVHVQNFPHRALTNGLEARVHCEILHGIADIATNDTSTCAFTEQELSAFKNLIEGSSNMGPSVERTEMIARFKYFSLLTKFYNHHGESDARLERTKSILVNDVVPNKPPAWPLRILTFLLLFNAPDRHMREIGNIFVDEVVYGKYFEKMMADLNTYWKDFALTATVMMTVNVGFLAIPGVDISGSRGQFLHYTSVTSLALSFASMIISVILVQIHGPYSRCQNSITAQRYFQRHLRFGPLLLATMYCLPFVFFVWSAIAFSAAFVLFSTFTSLIGNIAFLAAASLIGFAIASVVAFFWHAADDAAAQAHVFQPWWWRWDEYAPSRWTSWFSKPPSLPLHATG